MERFEDTLPREPASANMRAYEFYPVDTSSPVVANILSQNFSKAVALELRQILLRTVEKRNAISRTSFVAQDLITELGAELSLSSTVKYGLTKTMLGIRMKQIAYAFGLSDLCSILLYLQVAPKTFFFNVCNRADSLLAEEASKNEE